MSIKNLNDVFHVLPLTCIVWKKMAEVEYEDVTLTLKDMEKG